MAKILCLNLRISIIIQIEIINKTIAKNAVPEKKSIKAIIVYDYESIKVFLIKKL